jgi:hypothetical protein
VQLRFYCQVNNARWVKLLGMSFSFFLVHSEQTSLQLASLFQNHPLTSLKPQAELRHSHPWSGRTHSFNWHCTCGQHPSFSCLALLTGKNLLLVA